MEYKITKRLSQETINEILKIEQNKGLTAKAIISEAEKKSSPLHDLFEWDDTEAAKLYRLQQARILVNEVKVIIDEKEYYAFENISVAVCYNNNDKNSSETTSERIYKPIIEILSNQEMKDQVIASALRQHRYWEEQNSKYVELMPIIKTASKVRKQMEAKWQKKKQ